MKEKIVDNFNWLAILNTSISFFVKVGNSKERSTLIPLFWPTFPPHRILASTDSFLISII